MASEKSILFSDLIFYWLAALPLLAAFLVWFYYWRKKTVFNAMIRRRALELDGEAAQQNFASPTSPPPPYDKPPSYMIYQSFPTVHKIARGNNGEVIISVEHLELPPPSYADAIQLQLMTKYEETGEKLELELQELKPPR